MSLKCVVLLVALATVANSQSLIKATRDVSAWWKTGVFYQIYPKSFKDSNSDGLGDLQGIISKMDHFKDLGVTAVWLSPIYKSPQVDAGYDISNFKEIDPIYGTMEDFNALIEKAKEIGVKIIMDFVPNHSSDKHDWFIQSEQRVDPFTNYYVWRDGADENKKPPNNWLSIFKNSAWTYSEIRKQWYYHQFAKEQPDLNYENTDLVNEMKDVLTFWLNKGVYGFRADAVPFLFEDGFEDEPVSNIEGAKPGIDYESLIHTHTMDQDKTFQMIYQFRETIDEFNANNPEKDERIMMTEAYTNIENTMKYYGNGDQLGAHFTFNFQLITAVNGNSKAADVIEAIETWMTNMPEKYTANWVIGNHDNHRVASRVGKENVDGYNMLVAILPGVGVTYNGEEIGMEDGEVSFEQGDDPSGCVVGEEGFPQISRDFERTPFHWNNEKNAGFSDGENTWLPVSSKYVDNNLAKQKVDTQSHYTVYKNLIQLRQSHPIWKQGNYLGLALSENVIMIIRRLNSSPLPTKPCRILIFNMGNEVEKVNLSKFFKTIFGTVQLTSVGSTKLDMRLSQGEELEIAAHESFIANGFVQELDPTETTVNPTQTPTENPTQTPTENPTQTPTGNPTQTPTEKPTEEPTKSTTQTPTEKPTEEPTKSTTQTPTEKPTEEPTKSTTQTPTEKPTGSTGPTTTDGAVISEICTFALFLVAIPLLR